jgi:hypothetical protein
MKTTMEALKLQYDQHANEIFSLLQCGAWSEEQVANYMAGVNAMLSLTLRQTGCFDGFVYIGTSKEQINNSWYYIEVTVSHPEFKEWRRRYL